MKWTEIKHLPTTYKGGHESILKAYQTLQKVKDYLKRKCPADIILELIEEVEER